MAKAKAEPAVKSSSGFLIVGCKMPNGLILHVDDMIDGTEPVLGGGSRATKVAMPRPETYKLNGTQVPYGVRPGYLIVAGYALTPSIPADFFEQWLAQNADSEMVKNHLIIAYEKDDSICDAAKDGKDLRSGLQPLVPDNDTRIPKRVTKAVKETEDA